MVADVALSSCSTLEQEVLGNLEAPEWEPHVTRCHKLEDTEPSSEGTQCNESHKLTSTPFDRSEV